MPAPVAVTQPSTARPSGLITRLVWACDVCGKPIADGAGYVTIDMGRVRRYENETRAWDADVRARNNGTFLLGGHELFGGPKPPPWQVLHATCDPNPDSGDYWWAIERCRSAADVIAWTAHLLHKSWFPQTPWAAFLRKNVLSQLGQTAV